jgi:hypothetical protein
MKYLLVVGMLVVVACSDESTPTTPTATTTPPTTTTSTPPATSTSTSIFESAYPPSPGIPDGPLDDEVAVAIDALLANIYGTNWDGTGIDEIVAGGDPRTGWLLADLLRFFQFGEARERLAAGFAELTGIEDDPGGQVEFVWATNHLIAWDMPAWDGYADAKRRVFGPISPIWDRFFAEDHGIDWRLVTWGGVGPDERPLNDNGPCSCIPSLDYPATTGIAGGDWYADNRVVFGVVVGDEAIALPRHQMEVHEMVNLTLGGRELGIPYCTLCGSAQAYFVDDVAGVDRVVLRTSGLLSRSNKLMYDVVTGSAFDTFTGRAVSGPLGAEGVVLEQVSVAAALWGDWKDAHPDTQVLAEDGGIGFTYRDDPLGGRDAAGPIFPVGDIDGRLGTSERVVGVIAPDGTPVAFPVSDTREALADGDIEFEDLIVRLEDSIRVYDADGNELVSHEAFWFAWSQFHDSTLLWGPEG